MSILKENGIELEIRNYLKDPPTEDELRQVAKKLQLRPAEFIRAGEKLYSELGVENMAADDEALFRLMSENPQLIERPIIIAGDKAVLGRPPQRVKDLL